MDRICATYLALDAPSAAGLYPRGISPAIRHHFSIADGCLGPAVVQAYMEFAVINLRGWATAQPSTAGMQRHSYASKCAPLEHRHLKRYIYVRPCVAALAAHLLRRLARAKALRPLLLCSECWSGLLRGLSASDPALLSLEARSFRTLVQVSIRLLPALASAFILVRPEPLQQS